MEALQAISQQHRRSIHLTRRFWRSFEYFTGGRLEQGLAACLRASPVQRLRFFRAAFDELIG